MGCVKLLCFIFHNIKINAPPPAPAGGARGAGCFTGAARARQPAQPTLADLTPKWSSLATRNYLTKVPCSLLSELALSTGAPSKCKTYYYA